MRSPTRSRLRSVVLAVSMAAVGTPAVVIAAGVARGAASSYSEAASAPVDGYAIAAGESTNPFNFAGPIPGRHSELAVPVFGKAAESVTLEELKGAEPRAGRLAEADTLGLRASSAALVTSADGKFYSSVLYESDKETVFFLESWSPNGAFLLRVPTASPVSATKQTTISGHPALTQFPTRAVVGGLGPRDVFVEVNGVYHHVLAYWSTSDADVLATVERMISEVSQ
ncbi:MAG: hypothetical protein HS107_10750 [Thermoflexaceae bacterium]|nr:hypothetical protein [Thermoflexaceae bacterium]